MSDIKTCPNCGSRNLEFIDLDNLHPSLHCIDCNILITKLTKEQIELLKPQTNG